MRNVAFVIILFLSGCITLAQQNREYREGIFFSHPEWPENVKQDVLRGEIKMGMTQEMVIVAWGNPYDINTTTGTWGTHEQWIYGYTESQFYNTYRYGGRWVDSVDTFKTTAYLYFEDRILTSWQY